MVKDVDPSDIGKHQDLIKKAQKEMASSDIHVCGKCHSVFQFVELFLEHREEGCTKEAVFRDSKETKPKVWAFLLWKAAQLNTDNENINAWKLYQNWIKLDDTTRETWIVAGRTIQSFTKFGQGNLHEMPVKITKTVVDTITRTSPANTNETKKLAATPTINKPVMKQVIQKPSPKMDENKTQQQKSPTIQSIPINPAKPPTMEPVKVVKKQPAPRAPLAKLPIGNQLTIDKTINRMARKTIPNSNNETAEHKIEKILAKRFNPRRKEQEYLIKWDGFSHEENTWERKTNLDTCPELLDTFEKQLARQKEQRAALQAKQEQLEAEKKAAADNNIDKPTTPSAAKNVAKTVTPKTPTSANAKKPISSGSPLNQSNQSVDESPTRLTRSSKAKALDTVRNWCSDSNDESSSKKRKSDDSDYDQDPAETDEDDSDEDESFKLDAKKSDASQTKEPPAKMIKTDTAAVAKAFIKAGQSGNVRITPVNKTPTTIAIASLNSAKLNGPNAAPIEKQSADVVIKNIKDNKPTGIVKKPGVTVNSAKQTEAQVHVVQKGESTASGVVRIGATNQVRSVQVTKQQQQQSGNTTSTVTRQSGIVPKPTINTRPAAPRPTTSQPVRSAGGVQTQLIRTSTPATSPNISTAATSSGGITRVVQKTSPNVQNSNSKIAALERQGGLKITRKTISANSNVQKMKITNEPADYDLSELFPKNIQLMSSPSPTRELTLCPITGNVLSQAEGEPIPSPEPEIEIKRTIVQKPVTNIGLTTKTTQAAPTPIVSSIQDDSSALQVLTNDDGTPMLVTGEDGTVYQVAGKNEQGQTVLITHGADGEQQFVYVANDEDDGSGLMTNMVDGDDTVNAVIDDQQQLQQQQPQQQQQQQQITNISETTTHQPGQGQMLTIQTDGEDGQITAEVIQADLPSPGGTRKVVLMLPDGSFVMTDVSDDQFQSLNLVS